jgi:hypothetical protein
LCQCYLHNASEPSTHSSDLSLVRKLLTLSIGIWSHGDIHTTDIEFGRLFAKFIEISRSDGERPTTQDVLKLHKTLLDAVDTAKAKGFAKEDPMEKIAPGIRDVCFKANYQIKYFNIKPLCRALIIIIENPIAQRKSHFEQQLVRLIRTEWTAGLSQPISFRGLDIQRVINENELVILLPEAVRFIMDLDKREEALQVSQLFPHISPLL